MSSQTTAPEIVETATPDAVATRIAAIRRLKGYTQKQLAQRMHCSFIQISRLENNERRLTLEWMRRFARALECRVGDLLLAEDLPIDMIAIDPGFEGGMVVAVESKAERYVQFSKEIVELVKRYCAKVDQAA